MPYLVESALAHLPYPADCRWRVKLRDRNDGAVPDVVAAQVIER